LENTTKDYTIDVDGRSNKDAARCHPASRDAAQQIANRVAFWKGADIQE